MNAYRPEAMDPRFGLMDDGLYRLSDEQAEQILQMRLQRLTGLEQDKIVNEYREVMEQITDLLNVLATPARITDIIAEELLALKSEFGDTRRSEIVRSAQDLITEDLITPEDMVVTLSHAGYIRASRSPTIARSGAAGAVSRRHQHAKTTGSISSSSLTRTTRSCASPIEAGCIG